MRIRTAKTLQPTQNAKTDSSVAATVISADQDERRGGEPEPEVEDHGGDREGRADRLRESLGRARDVLRLERQARRQCPSDELTERAERGSTQHARDEPVREQDQQDRLLEHDRGDCEDHDAAHDEACGHLVDRVREGEELLHVCTIVY